MIGTIVKRTIIIILLLGIVFGIVCAGYAYKCIRSAPQIDTSDIYSLISQKTLIYDDKGNEVDSVSYFDGNRIIVSYDDISPDMINAIVAIEDKTFWTHHGFNFIRMMGAIKERVVDGGQIHGTSTITQQLARNVYLSEVKSERTLKRKIVEAYYTVILEREMTKKAILEAYLNTVYFGYGSYGVQTAAQNYFGKTAESLSLAEAVALAALPQAPDAYALMYPDYDNASSLPVVDSVDGTKYVYNGDVSAERRSMVLSAMEESGYITASQKDEAKSVSLIDDLKVTVYEDEGKESYFIDYVLSCLKQDLSEELGIPEEEASHMVYSGGLSVHTTMNAKSQKRMAKQFEKSSNYTSISGYRTDEDGNIISNKGQVLLYKKNTYLKDGDLLLSSDDFEVKTSGDITVLSGGKVSIEQSQSQEGTTASIFLKDIFENDDGFNIYQDGKVALPAEYLSMDENGNCVIDAKLRTDLPNAVKTYEDNLLISSEYISLGQKVKQPQAAAVLIDNTTGYVNAIIGGRGVSGRQLYNRAIVPHQPGSSIKPIGVYGPALQTSADLAKEGETMKLDYSKGDRWGNYITAGSVINDAPIYRNGKQWPKNSYSGYRGRMTLRKAVQQSVNVCAVKVFSQIGEDKAVAFLKKNGISTIDEEGSVNDLNPASLALGGMSSGISPLELAAAYETFPNGGTYKEPIVYTKVVDRKGNIILEKDQKTEKVYDESVAWIMTNILQSVVKTGTGKSAAIGSQPVGGKTGTTSDQYDIWFAGFTPQYTMALWEGNDLHIELSSMSEAAAGFWSNLMGAVCEGTSWRDFREKPDDLIYARGEYYAPDTLGGYTGKTNEDTKKTTEKKRETRKRSSGSSRGNSGSSSEDDWYQDFLNE